MSELLNTKLSIDKSTWIKVKLGDVVTEPRDTVKDFTKERIDHVVGLEHIDAESIHLRRSANMDNSTTFTKKFKVGDVLFGRRRAYLKKAVQAKFSGICSGDITVMRVKKDLLPELLPFVINNEKFFDYAVKHSAGGLSPRVKFKDLANYEFLLPPKDQQAKLAELLWAMDNVVEGYFEIKRKLEIISKSFSFAKFNNLRREAKANKLNYKLEDLVETSICNGVFKTREYFGNGSLLINVTDIYQSFEVNPNTLERVEVSENEKTTFSALQGDVIFNRSSLVKDGIGHACLVPCYKESMVFECHLMRTRPNKDKIYPSYLCRYCLSPFGRNYLISRSQTTTMTTINQTALNKMPVPVPKLEDQIKIANLFDGIDNASKHLDSKISTSNILKGNLINLVF